MTREYLFRSETYFSVTLIVMHSVIFPEMDPWAGGVQAVNFKVCADLMTTVALSISVTGEINVFRADLVGKGEDYVLFYVIIFFSTISKLGL